MRPVTARQYPDAGSAMRQLTAVRIAKPGLADSREEVERAEPPERADQEGTPEQPGPDSHAAPPDSSVGYAAEHAVLAFGIPRVAPVPIAAGAPPGALRGPADAAQRAAKQPTLARAVYKREAVHSPCPPAGPSREVEQAEFASEDLTESLTAEAARAAAAPAESAAPVQASVSSVSDQLTAVLTMPPGRGRQGSRDYVVDPSPPLDPSAADPRVTELELELHGRVTAPLQTAALPIVHRPAESATTTWSLPATTEQLAASARPRRSGRAAVLGAVALAGVALGAASAWFLVRSPPPARVAPVAARQVLALHPDAAAERLIEQALSALRAGDGEHAATLLLRYKASRSATEAEPAVDIMLRLLQRDATAGPAR